MKLRLTGLLCGSALVIVGMPAHAATVTFNLDTVFSTGSVAPGGPAPYGTITFDDNGSSGSVQMTIDVSASVGMADLTQVYLNFDSSMNVNLLNFTFDSGDGPTVTRPNNPNGNNNGIFTGVDAFQADGDGLYDILFDFPPPGNRFNAGESVLYSITSGDANTAGDAITANSFNFLSAPGGNAAGPFLAASFWQSTGELGENSAWVAAVPVPAAVWLFGSGLIGLAGLARRKQSV